MGDKLPWSDATRQGSAGARSIDDTAAELRVEIANLGGRIEHYELIRPLGRGGMGTVHLARDTKLGRLVAIKLLRSRSLVGAERFRVEARATARCAHENIVVIHDVGEQRGYLPLPPRDRPVWARTMQIRHSMRRALQIILAIGVGGLLFSGYLSYGELFASRAGPTCPTVGEPGTILGFPACVYGFFMYLAIVVVAAIGLTSRGGGRARNAALGSVI